MKRVLVLGSGGAGKTTFSLALAEATGLPVVHLDEHFWRPGWVKLPTPEWHARVRELAGLERWIMDGNYGGSLDLRLAAADTVILLDTPRLTCLRRVLRRRIAYRGRSRPSLPEGCPERITFEFLHWIWTYPRRRRGPLIARLEAMEDGSAFHLLGGDDERLRFIAEAGRRVGV